MCFVRRKSKKILRSINLHVCVSFSCTFFKTVLKEERRMKSKNILIKESTML